MSLATYMRAAATTKGQKLESSNKQKGREKMLPIIALNHEIVSPRDPASGLPTGKRQHKPLTLICELDRTYPIWQQILTSNDNIKECIFDFWTNRKLDQLQAAGGAGGEVLAYTIKLTNASVCSTELIMLNNKNPELMKYETHMRIALTYQRIEWTWTDGGIMSMDDWETPVVS